MAWSARGLPCPAPLSPPFVRERVNKALHTVRGGVGCVVRVCRVVVPVVSFSMPARAWRVVVGGVKTGERVWVLREARLFFDWRRAVAYAASASLSLLACGRRGACARARLDEREKRERE